MAEQSSPGDLKVPADDDDAAREVASPQESGVDDDLAEAPAAASDGDEEGDAPVERGPVDDAGDGASPVDDSEDGAGPVDDPKNEHAKPAAKPAPRRWRKRLAIGLGTFLVLLMAAAALVKWSIGEHDRLMLEQVNDQKLRQQALLTKDVLGGQFVLYRAPAIVRSDDHTLLVFAEGRDGTKGDRGHMEIVSLRSEDDGQTWSAPKVILSVDGATTKNPAAVVDYETGAVWLAYRQRPKGQRHTTYIVKSDDDGRSWGKPINLSVKVKRPKSLAKLGNFTPSPGHGIQLVRGVNAGRLIMPTYSGHDNRKSVRKGVKGSAQVLFSDNHGKTWQLGDKTDYGGENQIVETTTGYLLMLLRTRAQKGSKRMKRLTSSHDGGATWAPTWISENLTEPVCQASWLYHEQGGADGAPAMVLASPGVQATGRWDKSSRRDLTVFVSTDEGKTWPVSRLLHRGGASYSDLAIDRKGRVHVVYEAGTKKLIWGGKVMTASFHMSWLAESYGPQPEEPFSEKVYSVVRHVRGPLEDMLKGD